MIRRYGSKAVVCHFCIHFWDSELNLSTSLASSPFVSMAFRTVWPSVGYQFSLFYQQNTLDKPRVLRGEWCAKSSSLVAMLEEYFVFKAWDVTTAGLQRLGALWRAERFLVPFFFVVP